MKTGDLVRVKSPLSSTPVKRNSGAYSIEVFVEEMLNRREVGVVVAVETVWCLVKFGEEREVWIRRSHLMSAYDEPEQESPAAPAGENIVRARGKIKEAHIKLASVSGDIERGELDELTAKWLSESLSLLSEAIALL